MKRTTVTMPDELAELVAREARRRNTSVSGLVRELVAKGLDVGSERREIPWAAIFDDPGATPAANLDDALDEGWADDIDRDRR